MTKKFQIGKYDDKKKIPKITEFKFIFDLFYR